MEFQLIMSVFRKILCYFPVQEVATRFGLIDDGKMYFVASYSMADETCIVAVDQEQCVLLIAFGCSSVELTSICLVTHGPDITRLVTVVNTATLYPPVLLLLAYDDHEYAWLCDAKVSRRKQSMHLRLNGRGK